MNREQIRAVSIGRLEQLGVSIPVHLPFIEIDEELEPKRTEDVTGKISALGHVIGLGYGASAHSLVAGIDKYDLWAYVSPHEAQCLRQTTPLNPQEKISFKWLAECVYAFAWCLGITDLNPGAGCPDNLADLTVPGHQPDVFRLNKHLRPMKEILQEADFHHCLHWYERQSQMEGEKGLAGEVTIWERRRALDWVIGVSGDWDDMPRDT